MLAEGHIYSIKTKDETNVADVKNGGAGIVITGLNVLRDQISRGDFVFVVFGGDKPKGWTPGLVALAHISREPFSVAEDQGRNFRVEIDVDVYFQPSIVRADLVTYPDTFGTIGIGPITKWEPNQAITSVLKRNAIGLIQAICDLRPQKLEEIKNLLGADFALINKPVRRYVESTSKLGAPNDLSSSETIDLRDEFEKWLADGRTSAKTAYENAASYIPSIDDGLAEPTKQIWHGLREALYGERSSVRIYAVRSYAELMTNFGGLDAIFDQGTDHSLFGHANYQKCSDWAHDSINHGSIRAAWRWYKKFLQWKDAQANESEISADRLSVALKLFAEHRLEADWTALLKRDGYEGIRARYEGMNPETLRDMTAAEFDEWANKELWALQHYRCKQTFDKLTDEQKTACARFVAAVKKNVQPVTSYFPTTTNCPEGVGPVVATELLMKFHPQDYIGYSALMLDGMKALKLLDADPQYDTAIGYQKTMGIASQILEKMFAMKLTRSFDDEKYIKPDYITVNEFLWWCKEHQDLIKEEIMKQKMKKPNIAIRAGSKTLGALIGQDPDSMMSRLTAALLTKPFAILAGASGTGKSRMVRQLAYMTCLNTDLQAEEKDATAPGNYRLVQVKPNWHDSSDLLGYRSAINEETYVTTDFVKFVLKAHAYPDTPFFVCLDEMNLAPVEQYFAEFLSASEDVKKADDGKTLVSAALIKPSDFGGDVLNLEPEYELAADRKALIEKIGLFIPHNLYVVGTVNMDDTTCQFSRKVLDRAMTIEMNEVKLATLQQKDVMTFDDLLLTEPEIKLFGERAEFDGTKLDNPFRDKLDSLRGDLESSPFAIAYRFAREAVMYREAIAKIGNETAKIAKDEIALDHMALMKILPRITGTTTERKGVTDKLSAFFTGLGRPLSLKKLNEMIAAASGNGEYLSFWP